MRVHCFVMDQDLLHQALTNQDKLKWSHPHDMLHKQAETLKKQTDSRTNHFFFFFENMRVQSTWVNIINKCPLPSFTRKNNLKYLMWASLLWCLLPPCPIHCQHCLARASQSAVWNGGHRSSWATNRRQCHLLLNLLCFCPLTVLRMQILRYKQMCNSSLNVSGCHRHVFSFVFIHKAQ